MRIGSSYAPNKMYRGIRVSNGLPYLAEDIHEFSDTLAEKSNYLLESIVGSGLLKPVMPTISSSGIAVYDPSVLNIEGDICLIANNEGSSLVTKEQLSNSINGTIFIVGFYTHITATDTLREYGGMMNGTLENNLLYEPLDIQVSSRYQFIWDAVVIPGGVEDDNFSLELRERDNNGAYTSNSYTFTPTSKVGSVYKTPTPADFFYESVSDIYMIPFLNYTYDSVNSSISNISSYPERQISSSGRTKYRYIDISEVDILTSSDLTYTLDVSTISESDIVRVTYEGLELVSDLDYTVDINNKTVTLLDFTRVVGDRLVITIQ